ncbi:MAG: exopolysaccharide Pel transporter PelG [Bacillota bacterium]|nr:exopolysaccharide Pel transporter PelG [Bacillota bacterium]
MAGIGFELKKLFVKRGIINNIRAYFYSTIVTAGPVLLCVTMITVLQLFLSVLNVSYYERQLFIASTIYSFIFSQVLAGSFSLIISRYVSDKIYLKKRDEIIPSLYGSLFICLIIGGISGALFYWLSPLSTEIKSVSYILFILLIMVWIQTIYLSAMKDFMRIVKGFLYGILLIIISSLCWLKFQKGDEAFGLLLSMDIGFFVITVSFFAFLKSSSGGNVRGYFHFVKYLDMIPSLLFIGAFYNIAIYAHNFMFWLNGLGITVGNTYVYAPLYDVPTFYAFLTTVPTMVFFTIEMETNFYLKYKTYYSCISEGGDYKSIKEAGETMIKSLWEDIRKITSFQIMVSFLFILCSAFIMPRVGISEISIDIFYILVLGVCAGSVMFILMTVFLYFEDRRDALITVCIFFAGNVLFTQGTIMLNVNLYGFGYFISALVALVFAFFRLNLYLKDLDYHAMCSMPATLNGENKLFSRLIDKFYKQI